MEKSIQDKMSFVYDQSNGTSAEYKILTQQFQNLSREMQNLQAEVQAKPTREEIYQSLVQIQQMITTKHQENRKEWQQYAAGNNDFVQKMRADVIQINARVQNFAHSSQQPRPEIIIEEARRGIDQTISQEVQRSMQGIATDLYQVRSAVDHASHQKQRENEQLQHQIQAMRSEIHRPPAPIQAPKENSPVELFSIDWGEDAEIIPILQSTGGYGGGSRTTAIAVNQVRIAPVTNNNNTNNNMSMGFSFLQQELFRNQPRPLFEGSCAKWARFETEWEKYINIIQDDKEISSEKKLSVFELCLGEGLREEIELWRRQASGKMSFNTVFSVLKTRLDARPDLNARKAWGEVVLMNYGKVTGADWRQFRTRFMMAMFDVKDASDTEA